MTTICHTHGVDSATLPVEQTWAARLKAMWRAQLQGWRDRSRLHAEMRALDGLDDRTLHDIGLAERRMGSDLPGAWRDLPGAWRDPRNVL